MKDKIQLSTSSPLHDTEFAYTKSKFITMEKLCSNTLMYLYHWEQATVAHQLHGFTMNQCFHVWLNGSIFLVFHIASPWWAWRRCSRKQSLLLKFHLISTTSVSCSPGLILIWQRKHRQRSNGNCGWSFCICCLLRLWRVMEDSLLQMQKSYPISLREHYERHGSATLGDWINFDTEMT